MVIYLGDFLYSITLLVILDSGFYSLCMLFETGCDDYVAQGVGGIVGDGAQLSCSGGGLWLVGCWWPSCWYVYSCLLTYRSSRYLGLYLVPLERWKQPLQATVVSRTAMDRIVNIARGLSLSL